MVGRAPQERGTGTPVDLMSYGRVSQRQFSIYNGHSLGGGKMEERIRHLEIHPPVSKGKLNSDSSWIANEHPDKIATFRVDLKEHRFAIRRFLRWRLSRGSFRGFGSRATEVAAEHGVFRVLRLFIDRVHDLFADS